ncbi:MAG TPA: aspartate/glutamate racemase family protein [Burkholderiales bacterium]|nr:aspartate/glutamate racemase family protein [Burkholderiales bacterium]
MKTSRTITIGIVSPHAHDKVPSQGPGMYPDVSFIARGVGVKALTPEGYDPAWNGIVPAAVELAGQGADAILVHGASLTFYRGYDAHQKLLEDVRAATGLPAITMSAAMVAGLQHLGAQEIGVCTAYSADINNRLRDFLLAAGFDVLALEGFDIREFGAAEHKTDEDIVALAEGVHAKAPAADSLLISCGGLRTLEAGRQVEQKHRVPVVSSTESAYWAAVRLVGESGRYPGYGKLLES